MRLIEQDTLEIPNSFGVGGRFRSWLLAFLIAPILLAFASSVQAQFTWITNSDNTITITGYSGSGGAVTIPDSTNGLTVTGIGQLAFQQNGTMTSVVIPSSVINIGEAAFFSCSVLASVSIPDSVTNIGVEAFGNCARLTTINVDAANSFYSSANGVLFDKSQATLIQYPLGQGGSYTISNSVTSIGTLAFAYSTLTNVTFPADLGSIGDDAFIECKMTSLAIPASVTNIGNYAFADCGVLTNVTIPNGVITIGDDAFYFTYLQGSVTIPESVTSIGYAPFGGDSVTAITVDPGNSFYSSTNGVLFDKNQTKLIEFPGDGSVNYAIPDGVTDIASGAFSYCTATNITIPNSVDSIGSNVFYYCYSLANVNIPDGVVNIGDNTFLECHSLASIVIPNSVTNIGNEAFEYCIGLDSITIGNGVTSIGNHAFYSCSRLPSVTMPNSVTSIGSSVFEECYSLTNVILSAGATSIGDAAFSRCTALTTLTIPDGVTSIGNDMFYQCYSLESVTIPNSVTNIGYYAFDACTNLTSVTIPGSVVSVGSEAFYLCTRLGSVFFLGNAPSNTGDDFINDTNVVYYLPNTTGWNSIFDGRTAQLWNPQAMALSNAGGHFGFKIVGPIRAVIVVMACTNLSNPIWQPVSTNALTEYGYPAEGASTFSDLQSGNYPKRFYRFRSP